MDDVVILGSGSAGLIAAMTIKRYLQPRRVIVVRSPEIGVIGVGESTTPNVPGHLFNMLGISPRRFYELAEPTWKLGVHFLWGSRDSFHYSFDPAMDIRVNVLPRPNGYYCDDDCTCLSMGNALMKAGKAFLRQPNQGGPVIDAWHAYHLENAKLVAALEVFAREMGVEIVDGTMEHAEKGPQGIAAIVLQDGRRLAADFFVDCSGFRSELLGKVLAEPFVSYSSSLFNDRAILASWPRTDEPILPYTTAETMDAGWAWQIEHEDVINRGYVYCSTAIGEEEARLELGKKNPRARLADRVVKFRTGRYQRGWVDNVLAIGNSCGFVEPLEATALMVICWQSQTFVELVKHIGNTPSVREFYNRTYRDTWDEIKDFLALHFWANQRLNTPYWQHCRQDTDISGLEPLLAFYRENGPTGYLRYFIKNTGSQFGAEGYLMMLVGNQVPTQAKYIPLPDEAAIIERYRANKKQMAAAGMDVREALAYIRHPQWKWQGEA